MSTANPSVINTLTLYSCDICIHKAAHPFLGNVEVKRKTQFHSRLITDYFLKTFWQTSDEFMCSKHLK
jgi:hypothetical protein